MIAAPPNLIAEYGVTPYRRRVLAFDGDGVALVAADDSARLIEADSVPQFLRLTSAIREPSPHATEYRDRAGAQPCHEAILDYLDSRNGQITYGADIAFATQDCGADPRKALADLVDSGNVVYTFGPQGGRRYQMAEQ